MIKPFKLTPALKDYIWGGEKLKTVYNKRGASVCIAEAWELSAHPDGASAAADGEFKGKTIAELFKEQRGIFGGRLKTLADFPMLIKLIDAKQNLSVQVHPSDEYVLRHENQFGKTEAWYIADNEPGAGIYCGFKTKISKDEYAGRIKDGTLTEVLDFIPVSPGQLYYIEAGTVHAIGAGVTIFEIQQNSNVTYRVYDYGRVGADGLPRPLHIEKALDVSVPAPCDKSKNKLPLKTKYFALDEIKLTRGKRCYMPPDPESFCTLTLVKGACDWLLLGETLFVPAGAPITLEGAGVLLKGYYS